MKYASTRTTKKGGLEDVCVVCGDGRHSDKIFFCRKFKGLKLQEKNAVVKKLGACRKCLGCHEDDGYCRDTFLCRNKELRGETPQITITLIAPKENTRVETRREVGKTAEERAN